MPAAAYLYIAAGNLLRPLAGGPDVSLSLVPNALTTEAGAALTTETGVPLTT